MFDLSQMLNNPQAQDAMLRLMSQQMANFSQEQRDAIAGVSIRVVKRPRGLEVDIGECPESTVDKWIIGFVGGWFDLFPKVLQAAGFRVDLYE